MNHVYRWYSKNLLGGNKLKESLCCTNKCSFAGGEREFEEGKRGIRGSTEIKKETQKRSGNG